MGEASGRLAVVTGAGSGIGSAVAQRLLAEAARVVAVDINGASRAPLVAAGATPLVADLAKPDGRARVVAAGRGPRPRELGRAPVRGLHLDVGLEEWKRIWAVNVDSMLLPLARGSDRPCPRATRS